MFGDFEEMGRPTRRVEQQQQRQCDRGTLYALQSLEGTWSDTKGSSYDVHIDADGIVVVRTTRTNGKVIDSRGLIWYDEDSEWITWGRSGAQSQFWLSEIDRTSLTWERDGSLPFHWKRLSSTSHADSEDESPSRGDWWSQQRLQDLPPFLHKKKTLMDELRRHSLPEETVPSKDESDEEDRLYSTDSLCGSWVDTSASVYTITAGDDGQLDVRIKRKSGKVQMLKGVIKHHPTEEWIVWGRRGAGEHKLFWLVDLSISRARWERDGSKPFEWMRLGADSKDFDSESNTSAPEPLPLPASLADVSSLEVDSAQMVEQLDQCFADRSLEEDAFLKDRMVAPDGWVPLTEVAGLPVMQACFQKILQQAVDKSETLELDEKGEHVRIIDEGRRTSWMPKPR